MLWYKDSPEEGDYVVIRITDVDKNSAYAELEEYENATGLIHISEISRSWVQDASKEIGEGEKDVAQVVEVDDDTYSLSLKRVNDSKKKEVMERWNKEQKVDDFVDLMQEEYGKNREEILEDIIYPLQRSLGSSFQGFEEANGREEKIREIIGDENLEIVQEVARQQINLRQEKLEGTIEVTFDTGDGIERIHDVFESVPEGIEVTYKSAPEYQVTAWGRNSELAKKRISEFRQTLEETVREKGGEFEFVRE